MADSGKQADPISEDEHNGDHPYSADHSLNIRIVHERLEQHGNTQHTDEGRRNDAHQCHKRAERTGDAVAEQDRVMDGNDAGKTLPQHRVGPEFLMTQPFFLLHNAALDGWNGCHPAGEGKHHGLKEEPEEIKSFPRCAFHISLISPR